MPAHTPATFDKIKEDAAAMYEDDYFQGCISLYLFGLKAADEYSRQFGKKGLPRKSNH